MRRFLLCLFLMLAAATPGRCDGAVVDGDVEAWLEGLDTTTFLLVDKQKLTLMLVQPGGQVERSYGIACGVNYGNKTKKGDHRTPEGRFPINEFLNSSDLTHDFHDGKGPVPGAYGPWFLRLDVPGFITIGIHGTHLPESIGSRATEGCIRLRNADILDLKERVALGMPVIILPDTLSLPVDMLLARLAGTDTLTPPEETEPEPLAPDSPVQPQAQGSRGLRGPLPWIVLALLAVAAGLILIKKRHANL